MIPRALATLKGIHSAPVSPRLEEERFPVRMQKTALVEAWQNEILKHLGQLA
jgi:hypothetical protein